MLQVFSALPNDTGQLIVTVCLTIKESGNEIPDHTREVFLTHTSQVSFSEDTQEGQ